MDVGGDGVGHLLHGGGGAHVQVLVLHAERGEAEAEQVDHVRNVVLPREHAGAAAEQHGPLGGEVLGLLDACRTVVAPDPACEHVSTTPGARGPSTYARPGSHARALTTRPIFQSRDGSVPQRDCTVGGRVAQPTLAYGFVH